MEKLNGDHVHIRGAKQNNLKNIDLDIPRDSLVVFTGVSGSGKSSIAFETIYAEAQRRYFDSIAPYARRLISQLPTPDVTEITGLPPAVALQQYRAASSSRSSVGTITTLSNLLRMLFSRAGTYPKSIKEKIDSDAFSSNSPMGACDNCQGTGLVHDVTEESLVPDPKLSIREKAIAAWPGAWQGKNYRDILATMGYNVDIPWKKLSKKDRKWILFTEESPVVTVHPVREAHRIQRPYKGTYMSAAKYVRHTFNTTQSATLRKRVKQFMESRVCPECQGKKLKKDSLSIKYAGYDIAEIGKLPLSKLHEILSKQLSEGQSNSKEKIAAKITNNILDRIKILQKLGLDYLSCDRATPTLSSGELQRLRLSTQLQSGLFGVIYVLDEPTAGLHPNDTKSLFEILKNLKEIGNSLFIVEHDMQLVKQADWIVDIGPLAGVDGGQLVYSGPVGDISTCKTSITGKFLINKNKPATKKRRKVRHWISVNGITKNNLKKLNMEFPLEALSVVSGVSGAGKSTLVSQVLSEAVKNHLGVKQEEDDDQENFFLDSGNSYSSITGVEPIKRLVCVDQKPIGRTPRSNLATYTSIFDHVRKLFASTPLAKKRKYKPGRFSFNVDGGRCTTCEGEGFISVELLFLPSVYAPCSHCGGSRYNRETLEVKYNNLDIRDVLDLSVNQACEFFKDNQSISRGLNILKDVGLGYLKLGQPATDLSGGEAQRIKLSSELQRIQHGNTLYILDEPTTGLHPYDVERLITLLNKLVENGNTVILIENDMDVLVEADWIIDLGPGAGENGGKLVACGTPEEVATNKNSVTAPYLAEIL